VTKPLPRLVLITDFSRGEVQLFTALTRALTAGPGLAVQLRAPAVPLRVVFAHAQRLKALHSTLFVSGRVDLALALDCHLHLPAATLAPAEARAALGPDRLISCAVHDEAEARRAAGADFALVSPVWPAGSKPDDTRAPLNAQGFASLAAALPCPAFALGGVTADRLRALRPRGAAAVSGWLDAADPAAAVRNLLSALPDFP
jgi:thiamine-phosphate pyrophosphorylase